ncbi:MAG: ABC transporter ATP-binding protein [bacterium]|nr:ABC transporter ATP-binding protein [bacterium]
MEGICFDIYDKSITAILGETGAGKTILAKALVQLLPEKLFITSGNIIFKNKTIPKENLKTLRGKGIFYVPQNARAALNPVVKIKTQINETSELEPTQLDALMKNLGFDEPGIILNSYPCQLSQGENQRSLIAMAAATQPELMVLDEPTSNLDEKSQHNLAETIKKLQLQYNLTILLITHNLPIAAKISDYIYILQEGNIVETKHKSTREKAKKISVASSCA